MASAAVVPARVQGSHWLQSARLRQGLSAIAAAIVYGGWALWVNAAEAPATALRLSVVHGSYAGLFTLLSAGLMEISFRQLGKQPRLKPHRWGLCFGLCNGLAFSVAAAINTLSGNPMVCLTILPGMLIGVLFSASYLHVLALNEAKNAQ